MIYDSETFSHQHEIVPEPPSVSSPKPEHEHPLCSRFCLQILGSVLLGLMILSLKLTDPTAVCCLRDMLCGQKISPYQVAAQEAILETVNGPPPPDALAGPAAGILLLLFRHRFPWLSF